MMLDTTLCTKLRRIKVGYDAPDQIQKFAHMAADRIEALQVQLDGLAKELEEERQAAIAPNPMATHATHAAAPATASAPSSKTTKRA